MSREPFSLRLAERKDIASLEHLIELSVRGLQHHDYTQRQIEGALGRVLALDTQLIEDGTYFVATPSAKPDTLVGCGGWSNRRTLFGGDHGPNRRADLLDPAKDAAKIRAIFIHPDRARQGLGTLLPKHCEIAAQQAGFRVLEMGSTLTGVPLYTLRGYEARERLEVPLSNGEVLPIVHMVKTL